jgi:hypothetical protein
MAVRVKPKNAPEKPATEAPRLQIPAITGTRPRSDNIIIKAAKIMLMDIRMLLRPKQTAEELEKYSQFADLARGKR